MLSPLTLALVSCVLLGLRHGFDYDHLAAITDITSVQRNWKQGMRLGLLYALGHAFTVALLGAGVILLHLSLPERLDSVGERLVGATLVVLAIYVLAATVRQRRAARGTGHGQQPGGHAHISRSRIALLVSGVAYLHWRVRRLGDPSRPKPDPFSFRYDSGSVFVVGIVHGLGAETPSQLLLFLLAANLGGTSRGLLGLAGFIAGLLVMNTAMTAGASGIFVGSKHRPQLQAAITGLTAVYSFLIGAVFLMGWSGRLPALVR